MNGNKAMKIGSILLTVIGAGVSIASNILDGKKQEDVIAKKVEEAIANMTNKES